MQGRRRSVAARCDEFEVGLRPGSLAAVAISTLNQFAHFWVYALGWTILRRRSYWATIGHPHAPVEIHFSPCPTHQRRRRTDSTSTSRPTPTIARNSHGSSDSATNPMEGAPRRSPGNPAVPSSNGTRPEPDRRLRSRSPWRCISPTTRSQQPPSGSPRDPAISTRTCGSRSLTGRRLMAVSQRHGYQDVGGLIRCRPVLDRCRFAGDPFAGQET